MTSPLPFTAREFFELFARYNDAVWPAPVVLSGLAVAALALILVKPGASGRSVSGILALLWVWMGGVYHFAFFTTINPAAWLFGAAFVAQATILMWGDVRGRRLSFRVTPTAEGIAGAVLVIYALVLYPLIGYLSGHRYPATPTFGAPCPTTIFTLGVLLWISGRVPWSLVVIPVAWAAVGTFAAIRLAVPQDYGLLLAGLIAVTLFARRSLRDRSHARPAAQS